MRRISILLITIGLLVLCVKNLSAAPVDSSRAKQSAVDFFSALTDASSEQLLSAGVSVAYRAYSDGTANGQDSTVCFYVVNVGPKGFVMLSGDDRFAPVLGYSYESSFKAKDIPENLKGWLDGKRKEIAYALAMADFVVVPEITEQWNHLSEIGAALSVEVQPLLQTTWDQNAYYNQYCPADPNGPNGHAYAGCVATAMAQIVRYWEWPWSGFDSHSYSCDYGTLSVDFSSASYNYNNMPNSINGNSSTIQRDAVATLTYHCGVCVDMDYSSDGSGAASYDVMAALVHYFAYPSEMSYRSKSNYTSVEWNNLLRNELNNSRPVLYSGQGTGGHAFVCDGYDNNGSYHFNWGWSGYFNGYYALNALIPSSGSYSPGYNFTDDQEAIFGISAVGAFLRCSQNSLNVSAPIGGSSAVKTVDVRGHSLSGNITVTAGNGFMIGVDGSTFSNSVTMPAQGGRLYLRYMPTLSSAGNQNANVILASGTVRDTVFCLGTAIEPVCLPPQNLTGTHTGSQVNLSWSEPVDYGNGPAAVNLSWDSTVQGMNASVGSDMTLCMMQRFDVNDLTPYNQYVLDAISFIPAAHGTSFRLVVYKGGNYINGYNPGTQIVNQEVPASSLTRGTWNTVPLNSPVLVDVTEELWFGFVVYTTGNNGNVIRFSTGTYVPNKGSVCGISNGYNDGTGYFYWTDLTNSNFPIKGRLEQLSTDGLHYDVYRQASLIGSTTSTSYTDGSPLSHDCEYTVSAVWGGGCSQSASVTVEAPSVPSVSYGDTTAIACESFDWYEHTNINVSGKYIHTFVGGSASGGDSVVTLHLTVHHPDVVMIDSTICESELPITWNSKIFTETGTQTLTLTNAAGCDSIVTMHLTVNNLVTELLEDTACNSYTWNDSTYYESGEYVQYFQTSYGCDSVVTLHLTLYYDTFTDWTDTTCDTYTWNDSTYVVSGDYVQRFETVHGCDSIVTLHLYLHNSVTTELDATVCTAFLPLIWNGITFTEAGTQTVTLNNVYGCDSVVTMTLHVSSCEPPTVTTDTVYNITYAYATSPSTIAFGTVTDAGGSELTARGFCWSVDHNPTVNDSHTSCGAGTGTFSCNLTGLTSGTTYYVRAYATNSFGTAYGEEVSFTTCTNFTVSISGGTEIFLGQTACLTASGAEHFIWNTGDTTATLTVSPTVSTSYTVTGTDFVGCNKTASSMVYVRAMPTITPVEAGTGLSEIELFCGGQPVTLSANTVILTASDYLVASIPYAPPFSFTDGERLVENWDDNWTEASELTFPFVFYGNVYNQIVPGSNSVATFNADKANSFCAFAFSDTIPSTNLFSNTIFACYRDTYLRPNSSNNNDCVFAGVFGECPNRKYMLSFNNTHLFGSNYNIPGTFTTMIVLYEGTNVIDIYLQDTPNNSLINNGNGVVGLQNNTGTKGIAPPGRNTGPWIAHEEAWRFIPVPITDYTVTWYLGTDTTVATGVVVGTGDTITVLPGESAYYTARLQYTDNGESFDVANTCHVTVEGFESPISLIDSTVCAYDLPITWNGVTFTEAGTQTVTLTNVQGCDSIVSLHLTVNHSTDSIVVITACDSFTWIDGVTYYESTNSPTVTFTNADGCESVVTLHLTVIHSTDSVLSVTACDSFTWHGVTYFESTFTPTFDTLNAAGCDSTVTLHLTVHHSVTTEHDSTVCSSSLPMTWNGVTFTEAGTQTVTLQNVYGCDSVVVMHLTTLATPTVAVSATDTILCDGGIVFLHAVASGYSSNVGYQWYKDNVLIEGATTSDYSTYESARDSAYHYAVLVTTDEGCGSLAYAPAVTFVYDPVVYVSLDHDIICEGGTAILTANVECGVPIEELDYSWYRYGLNASTELVSTSAVLITAGEESPGQYVYWLTVSSYERGCMSTSMLANYAVLANPAVTIAVANGYPTEVCDGGSTAIEADVSGGYGEISYQWYKNGDLMAGDTSRTLALQDLAYGVGDVYTVEVTQTGVGCANSASAALDTLVNVASSASNFSATVCDSYIWDGVAYYASGEYVRHFQTSHGCDSIVTLHLTVNHSVTEFVEVTACDSYTWNGVTYTESGDYMNYHATANGCDSTVTLHLTIHHGIHNVQSETLCESYTWHGTTYTQSGTYTYDYTTLDGCSSMDTLKLTVNTPTSCTITDTVSENSLPYTLNDIIYTSTGTYTQTLVNTAGCDSILTVNLTVLYNVFTLLDSTVCDVCEWNGITYTQSGDYTQQFTSAIGSDSVVTLHLTVNHSVTELVEVTACDSYVWNDVTYTESGDYPFYQTAMSGCDSIVTLHLTINHPDTVIFPATACDSYNWNDVTYTESGDYITYLTNTSGCGIVMVLRLTVNHSDTTELYATACDSYTWNGETYTASGNYSVHLTNATGCDSTVTLHLTVNHSVTELVEVTACDSYTWNGVTYTESGDYTNYLTTVDGCDSMVTLHLTINHSVTELVEVTACDSYTWNGETYTESGIYSVNLNTTSGCDSLVTLHLTIHYSDTIDFYATACGSYNWNGEIFVESGDYVNYMTNAAGCDLVAILHLTIYETEVYEFSVTTSDSCYTWNGITYCYSGDYVQTFQTITGCDSVVILHLTITVGIDNMDGFDFKVYPNPTGGVVNVQCTKDNGQVETIDIQVFDAYGRYLQTMPVRGEVTQVNLVNYAAGIYFVKAVVGGQVVAVRKVVRD